MSTAGWVAWVSLVMVVALTTTNPLYLSVVLLAVVLVGVLAPRGANSIAGFRALLFLGASLFAASMAIAVINGNYGDHVLFETPQPSLPSWLGGLALGGPVTAEGLAAAAIRGTALLCVLLAFAVFNGAVSPHRVLRMTPAALFHAGLVVTIGLTLLPATIQDVRRIREMQALRGHRTGARSLPGLVVPAMLGGLERAMTTAEAMEARGYASASPVPPGARVAALGAAPLLLFAVWAWIYYEPFPFAAVTAAAAGLALLAAWAWASARARKTTRLRREVISPLDRALAWASATLALGVVLAAMNGWGNMAYNPFAGLEAPPFQAAGALIGLSCAWPALRLLTARQPTAPPLPGPAIAPPAFTEPST